MRVELGPVQETLLIPLLGRARETGRFGGLIHDRKAVEIVDRLEYDFSRWEDIPSLHGAVFRTRMFDEEVLAFLARNPEGTIVEIGCGLNTRYERLDNGRATWVELDLPDAMDLRREFFEELPRRTMIAASAADTDWFEEVLETGGPWMFVSEAALIFLDAALVEQTIRQLSRAFPGATLLMDTTPRRMVDGQASHDAMNKLGSESWFRWACDDPGSLGGWGAHLVSSNTFLDASPEIISRTPWKFQAFLRFAPEFMTRKLREYRINRFVLGA